MTLEQAQALTNDEIRVMIAELRGWKPCHKGCDGRTWRPPDDSGCQPHLPNYPADLNACRDAWQPLTYAYKLAFGSMLRHIVEQSGGDEVTWLEGATARQWCEAYVIVVQSGNSKGAGS